MSKRVLVFAALLTVVTPLQSFAECTWVLWTMLTIPALPDQGWGVVTAYPTMPECETALAKEFVRQKSEGWQVGYVQPRMTLAFKGKGAKIASTHWRCLPDTVDPREPRK